MSSLYDINEQLRVLEEYMVDPETGEILSEEEFCQKFDEIQMALNEKIESTICFAKNLDADIEAFKTEEKRLAQRRKVKENLSERLKNRINDYIRYQFTDTEGNIDYEGLNKYKMETSKMRISYRKSDKVNITDMTEIPTEFIKTEITEKPNLTEIKKAIKSGQSVNGAEIITNYNMQIS